MARSLTTFLVLVFSSLASSSNANSSSCYSSTLPELPPSVSSDNRTIPWGAPAFTLPNGTLCCDSLAQIRVGIDAVDTQLLELLAQRAAYVREATRFKATLGCEYAILLSASFSNSSFPSQCPEVDGTMEVDGD